MEWLVWMVAVAILGLAAVAASGRLGEFPATVTDTPQPHVPSGQLTGSDLRALRFAVVPRGYSMQQVDELLDRISRQLDHAPDEQALSLAAESPVEEPWQVPSTTWADPHGDQPGPEVEPQPPLTDDAETVPRHIEDAPAVPTWQAAEVVFAVADADADAELRDEPIEEVPLDDPSVEAAAGGEPSETAIGEDDTSDPVAAVAATEAAAEPTAVDPTAVTESEASIEPEPHPTVSTAKPKRAPKAKPSPVVAETEPVVDELEAQIAQIDTAPSSVADYGAALDDLVSKYSFRKVEHWYELPGFDIPAPADRQPSSEPMSDQPGQDSTADEI